MSESPEPPFSPEPTAASEPVPPLPWLNLFEWQVPYAILIVTLLVTNVVQLSMLLEQSRQLSHNKQQVDQDLQRAEMVRTKLNSLARDIVELAKTDPGARQIQDEMHIQVNDPNEQTLSNATSIAQPVPGQ
jgi:uncharacterized membrane protein